MSTAPIRLMKDRRREMIPVDKIKVINSRTRDEAQFALNVQSIDVEFPTKSGHGVKGYGPSSYSAGD